MLIVWALIGSMRIEEDGKMAMNVTPFVGTDNFNMETFNNMISQINNGVNSEISEVLAQLGTKAKIQTGSYVGTGTYGAGNPCSLTFDFVPLFVFIPIITYNNVIYYFPFSNPEGNYTNATLDIRMTQYIPRLTSTYQKFEGFGASASSGGKSRAQYGRFVGKTMYWYIYSDLTESVDYSAIQLNKKDYTYHWMAIG